MSRIGKKPVAVPPGVDAKIDDGKIVIKGALGTLAYTVPAGITVELKDKELVVTRVNDQKEQRALHGLVRSLVSNMVIGVASGFSKTLFLEGIGYRVAKQGNVITLTVGYSHPVSIEAPAGITLDVEGQNKITVKGADKQLVGQVAANIRSVRKPEPYKGKGIRYGTEVVRRKVGKTGA